MEWRELDLGNCSVAATLGLVGERWTLLVLREVFAGLHRFDEIADHLGISRRVLTERLGQLVDAGLLERRSYREAGQRARQEYHLTSPAHDLQWVLAALLQYGDTHLGGPEGAPALLDHVGCGGEVHVELRCSCGQKVTGSEVKPITGPGAVSTSP
ncbi:helix-turn-helix transcriptional regulator [Streptomyces sp. NBC_00056]|uniref:Helix-turn-helix transcriptional regulator n=1 Tax=Streptomyces sp. NBC_00119 TaxID=2975659 RepID=A0AAU1U485_9ACTN|nr:MULTISPECIES: helix-turn-helix domain-containing protein [unclassified Streptomyces]MCX4641643.1 helix-turn-helix transcriptional regulator [Streptomyces sp. NBC_01446]MCX5321947.1 helix-turn-helix transcriptional regulator [Streptomyces sp. NBC_00120]